MLVALFLATLPPLYPSPAKAGVQLRPARYWAPAFAGEREEDGPGEKSMPGNMSPIDAERAFAADAQTLGQWTAFAKWSADDAAMFVPQPTNAHEWLKDRKNPAKAIDWWPTASYISCDGSLAVNTGGWKRPDGSVGYFSTVWQKQADGDWKWIVDGGDALKVARVRPAKPAIVRASCSTVTGTRPEPTDARHGAGVSKDRTLTWGWAFNATGHTRVFDVELWDGLKYRGVIEDLINVE